MNLCAEASEFGVVGFRFRFFPTVYPQEKNQKNKK